LQHRELPSILQDSDEVFAQKHRHATLSRRKPVVVMPEPNPNENWRSCFEELAPRLVLYARQWLPSRADAEDAVQEGFVKFWRRRPDADPAHYPLLYAAVRSAALDALRQRSRRAAREEQLADEPVFVTDRRFESGLERPGGCEDYRAAIEAALGRLPDEQREVVVLRIWGELTFQQIANTVGESINTVAARYRYGLQTLRRVMKPHEYERV
jgi:RNA polymerase sigma-70 factor (ECF subfamily)